MFEWMSVASVDQESEHQLCWRVSGFQRLSRDALYRILAARSAVFVVEQQCPYQDIDGLDLKSIHVLATAGDGGLLAYARVVPPGLRFAEPSIGRVLTTAAGRGRGLGRALMLRALAVVRRRFPGQPVRISAQQYLEPFYRSLGFQTVGLPYDEDGIPHLEMLAPASAGRR